MPKEKGHYREGVQNVGKRRGLVFGYCLYTVDMKCPDNEKYPNLFEMLKVMLVKEAELAGVALPKFSNISLNFDASVESQGFTCPHIDGANANVSALVALGDFEQGATIVYDPNALKIEDYSAIVPPGGINYRVQASPPGGGVSDPVADMDGDIDMVLAGDVDAVGGSGGGEQENMAGIGEQMQKKRVYIRKHLPGGKKIYGNPHWPGRGLVIIDGREVHWSGRLSEKDCHCNFNIVSVSLYKVVRVVTL